MKRIANYSSNIIMVLVALTLVLHPFITHHHHFETSSSEYCACPVDTSIEKGHSGNTHCHKFNDFNEDKKYVPTYRVLTNLLFCATNTDAHTGLYELPLVGMAIDRVQPLSLLHHPEKATLRGPPSDRRA